MSDGKQEQEVFENGRLVIYRRSDSNDTYHCRIKFPNRPYLRKSLKTTDREEGIRLGKEFYWDCQTRFKNNIPFDQRRLSTLLRLFIDHLSSEKDKGRLTQYQFRHKKLMVERYFFHFFEKKELRDLDDTLIRSYKKWREEYWTKGRGKKINQINYERNGVRILRKINKKLPSQNTLRIEHSLLNVFLTFLVEEGYLKELQKPIIKRSFDTTRRRFTFSEEEYTRLYQRLRGEVMKSQKDRSLGRKRENLRDYVLLMTNFGTRPSELLDLRWKDIVTTKDNKGVVRVVIRIKGKTGTREVVGVHGVHKYLKRIWDRCKKDSEEQKDNTNSVYHHKPFVGRHEFVFVDYLGKRIKSFTKGFKSFLGRNDLYLDPVSQTPRSLYSLRHFYGTIRLRNGDSIYDVSLNMGTSVQMIEKHYSHVLPKDRQEVLAKRHFGIKNVGVPKMVSFEEV